MRKYNLLYSAKHFHQLPKPHYFRTFINILKMLSFFYVNDDVLIAVVSIWLEFADVGCLDSAYCNKIHREMLLELLHIPIHADGQTQNKISKSFINWLFLREFKIFGLIFSGNGNPSYDLNCIFQSGFRACTNFSLIAILQCLVQWLCSVGAVCTKHCTKHCRNRHILVIHQKNYGFFAVFLENR